MITTRHLDQYLLGSSGLDDRLTVNQPWSMNEMLDIHLHMVMFDDSCPSALRILSRLVAARTVTSPATS